MKKHEEAGGCENELLEPGNLANKIIPKRMSGPVNIHSFQTFSAFKEFRFVRVASI